MAEGGRISKYIEWEVLEKVHVYSVSNYCIKGWKLFLWDYNIHTINIITGMHYLVQFSKIWSYRVDLGMIQTINWTREALYVPSC